MSKDNPIDDALSALFEAVDNVVAGDASEAPTTEESPESFCEKLARYEDAVNL